MATEITFSQPKTWATKPNMERAIAKYPALSEPRIRYIAMQTPEGRYYPIFIGQSAIEAGAYFHFCTVGAP